MSVSIDITPLSTSLEMYGEPDTSSAYSLAGHVSISLTSHSSMFETRRAAHLLLQSLTITFEGQSEVVTHEIGYAPLRLCSFTRELVSSDPVELSNEGHEDKPCTWNVVFDLPVPGWLPATSIYGDWMNEDTGTRYALFATAKFVSLDDGSDKAWSLSTLCSIFRPKTKVVHAEKCPITLRRFVNPPAVPSSSQSLFPMANYCIRVEPESASDAPTIPPEIVSKIQVLASVPEHLATDDTSLPFNIRLRTNGLDEDDCKRLRLSNFSVDVHQIERYRGIPSRDFLAHYPIPSHSNQPPNRRLLDPHRLSTLFETGLIGDQIDPRTRVTRSFSIMHPSEPSTFELAGDGYIFTDDHPAQNAPTWYTVATAAPLAPSSRLPKTRARRASARSPLFSVRHEAHFSLMCTYDVPGAASAQVAERLHFTLPLEFVHVTPAEPSGLCGPPSLLPSPVSSRPPSPTPAAVAMPKSLPYAHSLPAYSQLFDSNGDRKIDYSVPLPLYTPCEIRLDPLGASVQKPL